jgi:hypothetical protein
MPAAAKHLLRVDDEIDLLRPHLLFMQGRGCHVDAVSDGPTELRQYQARYRGSFLHGGIGPEEMILPVAPLTPR